MTFQEFGDLLRHIKAEHAPFAYKEGLMIKYIDPHFDMRLNQVFSVTFRTFGAGEVTLHCQNECRDLPESLYDRCMALLDREA